MLKQCYGINLKNPDKEGLALIYGARNAPSGLGRQYALRERAFDKKLRRYQKGRDVIKDVEVMYGHNLSDPDKDALKFVWDVNGTTPWMVPAGLNNYRESRNIIHDIKILYDFDLTNPHLSKEVLEFVWDTRRNEGGQIPPHIYQALISVRKKRDVFEDVKAIYGFDLKNPNKEALNFIYNTDGKTPDSFYWRQSLRRLREDYKEY